MKLLTCQDDAYVYVIRLPDDATVSPDCEVAIGVEPNELVGDRFTFTSHAMLLEAARDNVFPGLELVGKTSKHDNANDAEMLEGLSPLVLVTLEEEAAAGRMPA